MRTKTLTTLFCSALLTIAAVSTGFAGQECGGDCAGDLNFDGFVDGADLGLLLGDWPNEEPQCGDINNDGIVDGDDLAIILGGFGEPCPPADCPDDATGDCCTPHFTAGCNEPECCQAICEMDSFCCEAFWDQLCVTQAGMSPACDCAPN